MNVYYSLFEEKTDKASQHRLALSLLDYALQKDFGKSRGTFRYGEHGKPYFEDLDLFMNYSHCEYGVACAVGESEVGVDICEVRKVRPAVIKRVCCDNELGTVRNDEDFIRVWVMKEAFAKFTGRGLSQGFATVDTSAFPAGMVCRDGNVFVGCYCEVGGVVGDVRFVRVYFV